MYTDEIIAQVVHAKEAHGSNRAVRRVLDDAGLHANAKAIKEAMQIAMPHANDPKIRAMVEVLEAERLERLRVAARVEMLSIPLIVWGTDIDHDDSDGPAIPQALFMGKDYVGVFQVLDEVPKGCPTIEVAEGKHLVAVDWIGRQPQNLRKEQVLQTVVEAVRDRFGLEVAEHAPNRVRPNPN